MPALTATRVNVTPVLNERARAAGIGSRFALHNTIVVAQVALSVIVLVGAGLFVRTLTNLLRLETGFDRQNLTVFDLQPPSRYDAARQDRRLSGGDRRSAAVARVESVVLVLRSPQRQRMELTLRHSGLRASAE